MGAPGHTSFHIDASAWPVVVLRFPAVPANDAEVLSMLAELGKQMARGRCAVVYDVPVFTLPNAAQRRALIDGIIKNRTASPNAVICHAVSTTMGPVMQGLIKIASWWSPAAEPVRIFDSIEEASEWARQQAAADGQRT